MGWLCIFTPQYFIDILQQTGSERGCMPSLGRETILFFRGGQESHGWGVKCWSPPPGSMCGLRVGAGVLRFQNERRL